MTVTHISRTPDFFQELKPPRQKPRVMAHVCDAGCSCESEIAKFECKACGWQSEWLNIASISEGKCGVPCEVCNVAAQGAQEGKP